MKLQLSVLRLTCRQSEEVIEFARNVSFFHGPLSAGKSSIARLVDFCLGGDLEQTTALQREFVSAHLTMKIGAHDVVLDRSKGQNDVQATWRTEATGEVTTALVKAKGEGPVAFGADVQNISDLVLNLLGYSILRVRQRTGDDNSPMVRLSFRDILKFCYLEQEELDSSFFRLATPVLAEKSKDALNFFAGYYSDRLSQLETEFDELRRKQQSQRDAAQRIKEFLGQFGFGSEDQIERQLEEAAARVTELQGFLAGEQAQYLGATHFVDDQRDQLRLLSDQLLAEKKVLSDLDGRLRDQQELRSELTSLKFQAARADAAKTVLEGAVFESCPNCGTAVDSHRQRPPGHCHLCLQLPLGGVGNLSVSGVRNDLDARVRDLDVSIHKYTVSRARQVDRIAQLAQAKSSLDAEVEQLLTAYESDRHARTRDAERQLAATREKMEFLYRVRQMPETIQKMLTEADALSTQISEVQRKIKEEQTRLSSADANFRELGENFKKALLAVGVPGVTAQDEVVVNRRSLIPEVWPNGDKREAYSFFQAGSGGKKTMFTICFALALHRTAVTRGLPVPTLLIIDTPLKNITPDINVALVEAFYEYLYDLAAVDLSETQVVIIDQQLVEPDEELGLEFLARFMNPADPEHPPLISYYDGP